VRIEAGVFRSTTAADMPVNSHAEGVRQMTHGGQKGFGMTKHGRSGHATRSPRFRFLQKLETQKSDRKDRSRIKDPKKSIEELFHSRKPKEPT
jgi:hypothetical protein